MNDDRIIDLIAEIKDELRQLDILAAELGETWASLPREAKKRRIHEESVALKLHNFYTGCERIFKKIADDINGGTPDSFDWHRRLLHSMSLELGSVRPPVISGKTETALTEFLGFRHVVRNIYGFAIDSERLAHLVKKFKGASRLFKKDITGFVKFLQALTRK
ncbi:MAG: hypothetical protein PHC61_00060 [Chitinivibrionales bacterium]|nr:hypothetical protein [Chitinivibrionales bacterium]